MRSRTTRRLWASTLRSISAHVGRCPIKLSWELVKQVTRPDRDYRNACWKARTEARLCRLDHYVASLELIPRCSSCLRAYFAALRESCRPLRDRGRQPDPRPARALPTHASRKAAAGDRNGTQARAITVRGPPSAHSFPWPALSTHARSLTLPVAATRCVYFRPTSIA